MNYITKMTQLNIYSIKTKKASQMMLQWQNPDVDSELK